MQFSLTNRERTKIWDGSLVWEFIAAWYNTINILCSTPNTLLVPAAHRIHMDIPEKIRVNIYPQLFERMNLSVTSIMDPW